MLIVRKSIFSGTVRAKDIDVTPEQLERFYKREENIQNIMPHLTDSEREFIMTGVTDDEWNDVFQDWDEEESPEYGEEAAF